MKKPRRRPAATAKVWVEVVKALNAKAGEAVEKIRASVSNVIPLLDKLLAFDARIATYRASNNGMIFGGLASLREIASRPAIGIDSSMSRPVRIGHTYYAVVDSAHIYYDDVFVNDPHEDVYADVAVAPDSADPAYAKHEINLKMFEMENRALREAAERASYGTTVFLDGPIIDPPSVPAEQGLRASYERYLAERAEYVRRVLEAGGAVVGVVKRVRGSLVARTLLEEIKSAEGNGGPAAKLLEQRIGDYSLALYAALALGYRGEPLTLVLRPIRVKEEQVPAAAVLEDHGVVVYTFLVVPLLPGVGSESKPLRVEVALLQGEDSRGEVQRTVAHAAAAIRAWLVPGTNMPRPVLMAHMRCSIRDRDSRRLLRELLSLSLYNAARHYAGANPELVAAVL